MASTRSTARAAVRQVMEAAAAGEACAAAGLALQRLAAWWDLAAAGEALVMKRQPQQLLLNDFIVIKSSVQP